jgi:tetratricopeptide (TPR) repeat protein
MTARYDRLAPLNAPQREQAFPGWSVLRDLDGAERDADAARRARLRFLALRPVLRMAQRGIDQVMVDSFERQVDRVREELGQLPARDAERAVLARLLNDLRTRQPELVVQALLTVSDFAEANGYFAAAAEYARAARELARTTRRDRLAALAGRALARVSLAAGHTEEARELAYEAAELALRNDDRGEWIRAIGQLAAAYRGNGDGRESREELLRALNRAQEWGNEALVGLALAQLCRDSAETGDPEGVIEHGWTALRLLSRAEDRAEILKLMGDAFTSLGMIRPAERCYSLISLRVASPVLRSAGLAGSARLAAESGDRERFRERRSAAIRELPSAHRMARAATHFELGRAAALVGEGTAAREHLQEALALLGPASHAGLRSQAEHMVHALNGESSKMAVRPTPTASEKVRRIAAELEQVADSVVTLE